MKKHYLLFAFSALLTGAAHSQHYYNISFEGTGTHETDPNHLLWIDTVANPDNTWQIGAPQKPVFTSANTLPNAIVTDTLNSYPVNDTSSFIIRHTADLGFSMPFWVSLSGFYSVDSDTLTDFGTIEFSPDNGGLWIDLVNDMSYGSAIEWNDPRPVLTGASGGWVPFEVHIEQLGPIFQIAGGDTVLFRFTFTSDGLQTNRDGLMFDSLSIWDVPPIGLVENAGITAQIFPNPSTENVTIAWGSALPTEHHLLIFDNAGRCIASKNIPAGESEVTLVTEAYSPGSYTCRLVDATGGGLTAAGKFTRAR